MLEFENMSGSKFPKVSVIIPNWNGKHLLKACLRSLREQSYKDFEVLVVDNGSTDHSSQYIKKNFPEVKVVELRGNGGFAHGANMGIKICTGNYMVLVNNDTKLDRNCLEFLAKAADAHPEVGMVAAKMLNLYNPKIIDSAGSYIDSVGHVNNIGLGEKDGTKFKKSGYVFLVTGGGGLFKREVFEKIGFLDEAYFAYYEDVDLCFRAQLAGFKGWYEPNAVIYHIHKASFSKNPQLLEYLHFRNMTQTIIKDFPLSLIFKKWRWLKIILVHINTIFYQIRNGFFWPPILADLWILIHLPQLLFKRWKIQMDKKVSNEYIESFLKEKKITFSGLLH